MWTGLAVQQTPTCYAWIVEFHVAALEKKEDTHSACHPQHSKCVLYKIIKYQSSAVHYKSACASVHVVSDGLNQFCSKNISPIRLALQCGSITVVLLYTQKEFLRESTRSFFMHSESKTWIRVILVDPDSL